jgi:hypothetical protein
MKFKLSRASIAILVVAFAIAGYGLMSSRSGDANADIAVAPNKARDAAGAVREVAQTRDQARDEKALVPARLDAPANGDDLSTRIDQLSARTNQAQQIHDVFAVSVPVAAPAAVAPPPPKPSAPPFPYTFIGAMQDGPTRTLYLTRSDRVVIARSGQVLDGLYHVDSIGAQALTVTYLPLHQQQVVSLGRGR